MENPIFEVSVIYLFIKNEKLRFRNFRRSTEVVFLAFWFFGVLLITRGRTGLKVCEYRDLDGADISFG